ncbi:MAG: radical SAM protein [Nitrososphaerota archaeon]|nr:radical SAM protein [Candidatus Bathyarchaeota archaeon]MDW8048902.1 radical SAM protein [Nitrososphaerota archaeon]
MITIFRPDAVSVLNDEKVRASLPRYFAVMQDKKPAKFLIAKRIPADFSEDESLSGLWRIHDDLSKEFFRIQDQIDNGEEKVENADLPQKSLLDLKIAIANRILENCCLCNRKCGKNRLNGELGYCRCGSQMIVSSIFEHMGEEPELVPSGTIFTMGCTIRCLHCQNWSISQWYEEGKAYTPRMLAQAIEGLRRNGCRNANLVGGEPTPWLPLWLEAFKHVNVNIPVVWNSNSYYSEETAKLLAEFADIYLLDFKYGQNECAEKISDAPGYVEVCRRNHLYGKRFGELIIRVLVLPGHLSCCTEPILKWISEKLGENVRVNLMFQYRPEWRAHEIPELRRRLTFNEMKKAVELAREAGLSNFIT